MYQRGLVGMIFLLLSEDRLIANYLASLFLTGARCYGGQNHPSCIANWEHDIMSLRHLFSTPSPETLEKRGDQLFAAGQWGQAKQIFERALIKLEKRAASEDTRRLQLQDKILATREALAREHHQTALDFLDGGYVDEAREALALAMEITTDSEFEQILSETLAAMEVHPDSGIETDEAMLDAGLVSTGEETGSDTAPTDEVFRALCHTLPEDVARAYRSYGRDFVEGYVALNNGDFPTAVGHLEQALADNPQPDSFIPLELASAYMNTGRLEEALGLLDQVREQHPEALPAYQLACEIHWELGETVRAEALLAELPPHLTQSRAVIHLKGETLYRSGHFTKARDLYRDCLETYGWHDDMARELAKVHEALEETAAAKDIYAEIIGRCQSCHARIDPWIKHRYAEISFLEGYRDADLLEMYLSLATEIPANAAVYFDRVSRIYASQGNHSEAERFRRFAARARAEQNQPPSS